MRAVRESTAEHDHGPTAQLVDEVWCLTCRHTHIGTIPATTFACYMCGFGSWGHSVAAAHAGMCSDHIVYALHHRTIEAAS